MELLKRFSRSALLAFAGVVLILLALSNGLELGPLKYPANPSAVSRILIACLGAILIVVSVVGHWLEQRNRASEDNVDDDDNVGGKVSAERFFQTLDELPGFQAETKGARRISILGRTAVNILTSYQRVFRELCDSGCEVRLIFVDPTAEASRYLYGNQIDVYRNNLKAAVVQVSKLAEEIGPKLTVRMTSDVPSFSLVHIEKRQTGSYFRVQLNFMHSRIGRDRPIFLVSEDDSWYQAFLDEYDTIWNNGRTFELQTVLRQLEENS